MSNKNKSELPPGYPGPDPNKIGTWQDELARLLRACSNAVNTAAEIIQKDKRK